MTLSATTPVIAYTGNGTTTAFSVPFQFFAAGDLRVTLNGVTQTLGTNYTVSGGNGATGTVTMTVAPASATTLRIERFTSAIQGTEYGNAGAFPSQAHELGMDRVMMVAQEARNTAVETLGNDISGRVVVATGSPTPRSLATRFGEMVNVRDHGAVGNGTTNDAPAFQAAVDSVPSGQPVRIVVPVAASSYLLNSDVVANGRLPVFVLEDGATLSGTGRIRCAVDYLNSYPRRHYGTVQQQEWQPAKWPTVDGSLYNGPIGVNLLRNGGFGTYGAALFNLTVSDATGSTEIDVGLTSWVSHQNLTGGQVYGAWIGANTPSQPLSQTWTTGGVGAAEFNTGNRWADWGLLETPLSGPRYTYGIQVVPDEIPAADGAPGPIYPGSFGVVTAPSIHGHKWWTGYFSWADAIMPGGYVMHLWGGSTAPNAAAAGIKFSGQYTHGIDLRSGTYGSNRAIMLANDQQVAMAEANVTMFANASNFAVNMVGSREGLFFVNNFGAVAMRWGHSSGTPSIGFLGAAAVTRPTVTGSRGGNAALASVLTALSNLGLITDSST